MLETTYKGPRKKFSHYRFCLDISVHGLQGPRNVADEDVAAPLHMRPRRPSNFYRRGERPCSLLFLLSLHGSSEHRGAQVLSGRSSVVKESDKVRLLTLAN